MNKILLTVLAVLMFAVPALGETVKLSWTKPLENVDGTPFNDLDHYNIYHDITAGVHTAPDMRGEVVVVPKGQTEQVLTVPAGQRYFIVTTVDTSGNESENSNEVGADILDTTPSKPVVVTIVGN